MRTHANLKLFPWPPGRACSNPEGTVVFSWNFVPTKAGENRFVEDVKEIVSQHAGEALRASVLEDIRELLKRAEQGLCSVVREVDGVRIGDVDRMGRGKSIVLELRYWRHLSENPSKLVRIYFTEPEVEFDLLAISARAKEVGESASEQQDGHWREAERVLRTWWVSGQEAL